ncbi:hypothetical protein L218DRAFT_281063 [Marasmius fiardii PR-910]|nr:hypothetical protein L218DRAFT_281063 [Marasmius fiardii PR-910]
MDLPQCLTIQRGPERTCRIISRRSNEILTCRIIILSMALTDGLKRAAPLSMTLTRNTKATLHSQYCRVNGPADTFSDDQILAIVDGLLGQTPVPIADLNSLADDGAIGGTAIDFSIGEDRNRSSVRDRLLDVQHKHPRKLTFSLDTLVTKVLMCTDKDGIPSAYGVEYAPGAALPIASNFKGKSKLKTRRARAKKEVIVSAGVFQSPQLLMLSGIGDRTHLKEHGIEPVVHLPGVGNNLQDHDEIAVIWRMKKNFSLLEGCTFGSDPERDPCLKAWRDEGKSNLYSLGPALEAFTIKTLPEYSYPDVMIYIGSVYFPGFVRDFGNPRC